VNYDPNDLKPPSKGFGTTGCSLEIDPVRLDTGGEISKASQDGPHGRVDQSAD